MKKYNCRGVPLTNDSIKIIKNTAWLKPDGNPDFDNFMVNGDKDGFLNTSANYRITIALPPGKRIVRYGHPNGHFTANADCDYDKLGLPYVKESMEYHEYIVKKTTKFKCIVDMGIVAPCFDSSGGEIQYYHHLSINDLLSAGVLVEDYKWLEKV